MQFNNVTEKHSADNQSSLAFKTHIKIQHQSIAMPSGNERKSATNDEESAVFARDPAAFIAQQVSKFKLEEAAAAAEAAGVAAGKAPPDGYLAGEEDGTCVRDFAVSGGDRANEL
ncbi:hypothetical protein M409DRAFT_16113 [Zasmidium cellare ATCC 36951]|uniref:Uncharacterized protein n=1 Tax=Zasmidium cellare ATCC 36951 TaxID=1080233 RepID=A0A6A6D3Z6_ZASCE|nr:uncharacterized protein M409DRAFT_16113 [Zasmidium cellare ATCC 36951]KAF2173843.1 hypothetical protein M409DRAFT_16113 [Zasmidium cellare ATCC 36951]